MQLRMSMRQNGVGRVTSLVWASQEGHPSNACARETHLIIGDDANGARLLEMVGFSPIRRFEMHRRQRIWNHCTVSLDTLPYLGGFVEISGATERQVLFVRRELGLDPYTSFLMAYPKMLDPYLHKIKLTDAYIPLPMKQKDGGKGPVKRAS